MLRLYRDPFAHVLAFLVSAYASQGCANSPAAAPTLAMIPSASADASAAGATVQAAAGAQASGAPSAGSPSAGRVALAGAQAIAPPNAGSAGSSQPTAGAPGAAIQPSQACAAMVAAAKDFIDSLGSDSIKSAVLLPFERHHNFAYEPQVADRPGVSFMMMSDAQQDKALALLRSGLSEAGFKKAETVRALENLKVLTGFATDTRDPKFYWLAIFGEPSETGAWGWQWEGHHLALHYALKACEVSDTPSFVGAWPSEVTTTLTGGPAVGTRNLAQEEELGRALAKALDADPTKRMQAFDDAAYRQMLPEGPDKAQPMTPTGLLASAMSDGEQMQLRAIVSLYAGLMPPQLAAARLKRIEDHGGLQKVSFVWTGALEPKQRHFYRIQGPSFFIEYRNDDGNHIHSVWRDFSGDFGDDLP